MSDLQGFDEYFGTTDWRELSEEQRRQVRVILPKDWHTKVDKVIEQKAAEILRKLLEGRQQRPVDGDQTQQ